MIRKSLLPLMGGVALAAIAAATPAVLAWMDHERTVDRRVLEAWQWIPHLNDDHEWTREAIADWLDSLIE